MRTKRHDGVCLRYEYTSEGGDAVTAALAALDTALPAGWKVSGIRFKHDLGGVVLMNGGFVGYPHGEHIRTVVTGNLSEMMADVAEWGDRGDD